jgi:hypothetical protein
MSERSYRLTVIACAASWLLFGAHSPVFHQIMHHGHNPGWALLAAIACLAGAGVATVIALWRATPGGAPPPLRSE